jgi:sugar lactone lactonase YvrE
MSHKQVSVRALDSVGSDLHRPECVVTAPSGDVFVPDWRGGVTRLAPDGTQETWLARDPPVELRPNGIAAVSDGCFLLANLADHGGIWRLRRDGALDAFLTGVEGVRLPPSNFVYDDGRGRTWISVSTRQVPRTGAWRPGFADGFIVLADAAGARIVADGLGYTNEVRPDPTGTWLYAVETFARRVTRFRIDGGGLGERQEVVTLGYGCFPDGFAFDEQGGLWITSLISNRLLRVHGGDAAVVLEDVNAAHVEAVERAFADGRMAREHLGPIPGTTLQQLTSLAFGGPDRRTVYLGSLHGTCVYRFRSEVAGA